MNEAHTISSGKTHSGTNQSEKHSLSFFEIKRFLVYNSTVLKLTYFYAILFHSKRICRQKEFRKKAKKGQIVIESRSFLKY